MIYDYPTNVDNGFNLPNNDNSDSGLDASTDDEGTSPPQYILTDEDGKKVQFYTMLEMSTSAPSQLPTEVIEKGSFATYNRVIEPMTFTAMLVMEGAEHEIQDALDGLNELKNGEKKVEFITPFETYENLMVEGYDYRRDDHSGHNTLRVEVRLKEVREVTVGKTTSEVSEPPPIEADETKDASCSSDVDYGETPTDTPTQAEQEAAEGRRQSIAFQMGL